MPFKTNKDRRHRIPKQRHRVTNWAEYEAGLRTRGSLTVWFTPEAIAARVAAPCNHPGWAAVVFGRGDYHSPDVASRVRLGAAPDRGAPREMPTRSTSGGRR